MTISKTYDFAIGDILMYQGDSYQVHENQGTQGKVSLFPSVDVVLEEVTWNDEYQRIGKAALPAPTPCATGSCSK
ncbi:MAG: hypothetical protein K9K86_07965 [Pseudomonadales bacterium]|nr:hypothetical protein [Pseudomonadales bacterium]